MVSLDNFHTGNPAPHAGQMHGISLYPYHLSDRHSVLQKALVSGSGASESWDFASRVPIGPIQPIMDPALLTGRAAPDPTYVERASTGLNDHYVVTRPRTHIREAGDTSEHKMLIQGTTCLRARLANWWKGGNGQRMVAQVNTFSRYHPYLGR